ncbi:hypothetical protein BDV93DRAFT_461316 [Ceratobasidium sp. AG-I]|nr:hypothetical protein BDV93DRAFT_461316 [Ceratobasidium sp. AG-I]
MNVSVSTNSGNALAIEKLLVQGGLDVEGPYLEEHVVLVHGDLGTGEKLANVQLSRCIEETPQNQLQYVQFAPGILHIEMAITDAIWRIHLEGRDPGSGKPMEPSSIYHLCSLTRPRDSKAMATNPDHRMLKHTIYYSTVALIVEAWRELVALRYNVSLSEWRPTWEDINSMSHEIVKTYVADPSSFTLSHETNPESFDMASDSTKLFLREALLWTAFRHARRHGDVGWLKDLLPFWVCIWKHTGKHKYAEYVTRFLLNLKEIWPDSFAEIVLMNWLSNPTGKIDGFWGMDWIVERNNLMHKVIHAGGGSNRTLENIIKESPLIVTYQEVHGTIQEWFYLTKSTLNHPPPAISNTLAFLRKHIREQKFLSHVAGRKLSCPPVDPIVRGALLSAETMDLGLMGDEGALEGENDSEGSGNDDETDIGTDVGSDVTEADGEVER